MAESWVSVMRDLAEALERSPGGDTPPNQSLIAKARTLAYRAEAARWMELAHAASPASETKARSDGGAPRPPTARPAAHLD